MYSLPMKLTVWSQWEDLETPVGFTRLSPTNFSLENDDLNVIDFYVSQYMGGKTALAYAAKMSKLRYFQLPNAGFEDAIEFTPKGAILCNARGVHDAATSELAIGLAIGVRRGFHDFVRAADRGKWEHKRYPSFNGSNVAIVGFGSIGQTLSHALSGFDVTVTGFSRSGDGGALSMNLLDGLLPTFDFVFLTLPLNADSYHLFNKERLALMKDGSVIINVARGPIIETEALISELTSGRLFAGLDVTDPEPLPTGHKLWAAKNLLLSPHVGGDSDIFESRGKAFVEKQLQAIASGKEPSNIVFRN